MVGLSELPLELKGMIVEWAAQIDHSSYSRVPGDQKISYELFSNGVAPRGSCIKAISQLDRAFFGLCRPILWKVSTRIKFLAPTFPATVELMRLARRWDGIQPQVLDLRMIPTAALSAFHGSETLTKKYIQTFVREIKTEVMIVQQPVTVMEAKEPSEFERFFQIEKVLRESNPANIDTLELELVLVGRLLDGYVPTCSHPLTARPLLNLSRLKNVKKFHIASPISLSLPQNLLVQAVVNMKVLTSFSADNIGYEETVPHPETLGGIVTRQEGETGDQSQEPPTTTLVGFLSNLKCLKSLKMYDSLCVDHTWSEMAWQSPLAEIVLLRCPNLSSLSLQRLSKNFNLSLRAMEVSTIGISEIEQIQTNSPGYLWEILQRQNTITFKKLRSLKLVGVNMGEHLLKFFHDSPKLRRVVIDSPNIRAQTLFKSLEKWPSLRDLDCRIRGGTGSLDLIMYCLTQGVFLDESFY
ncbi:hypothetical protein PGTUg99_024557 [Puccinia graminis f. sp. tritici]|uniref:F-box domain-containing protein n=1 Tax=Puccinia graminis f. sp. tritici TaxID=56615 RepID=A0A5B0LVJ5_PUCGR|nr:hypothetical protein PGTUg99_024557 [Puccinia graminis f. sp. tritici]